MQIVIDIPKDSYNEIVRSRYIPDGYFSRNMIEAIRNGTSLSEGHGRLIDADALNTRMKQRMDRIGDDESIWEASNVETALDMFAPTIIEADSAERSENYGYKSNTRQGRN